MLSRREAQAFCLAPATAPVVAAAFLGATSPWPLVAVVAYVAAFAIGAPLFACLRYRGWPLPARCLVASAIAGVLSALLLVTTLLLAFSVTRFWANLGSVAVFLGVGAAWGLGLGLVAGVTLIALLHRRAPSPSPA